MQSLLLGSCGWESTAPGSTSAARMLGPSSSSTCFSGHCLPSSSRHGHLDSVLDSVTLTPNVQVFVKCFLVQQVWQRTTGA